MAEKTPVKYTPPNCTALGCRLILAGKSREKIPACRNCCNDVDEQARRKALPLVKGPDGLRRKYLGIKEDGADEALPES